MNIGDLVVVPGQGVWEIIRVDRESCSIVLADPGDRMTRWFLPLDAFVRLGGVAAEAFVRGFPEPDITLSAGVLKVKDGEEEKDRR